MTENTGWALKVGKPFAEGVSSWPERFEYRFFGGNHLLQLCVHRITPSNLDAFLNAPVHLGLYLDQGVIFVLFKIQGFYDWSDQAFSLRLVSPEDRELPPHEPGKYQLLTLVLVDADAGLVRGIRVVSWSAHASAVLHRAMSDQLAAPFDRARFEQSVKDIYAHYPTSQALVAAAHLTEKAGDRGERPGSGPVARRRAVV
jgi:hypothetical protein